MSTPAKIMVVDDEGIVAKDLASSLTRMGYEVPVTASSGEAAVSLTTNLKPDLILMDIRLKGNIDGIEAARQIRSRHDLPVVYLTAYADDAALTRAQQTDAYGYMVKPFQEKELHSTIEIALHKHRMERKLRESEECYRILAEANPLMIWTARLDGWADFFGQRWFEYTGLTLKQSQGNGWHSIIHPYDRQRFVSAWEQSLRSGEAFEIDCCLKRASDQTYRWHLVRAILVRDQRGFLGWFGTSMDIDGDRQSREFLRRSYAHKRAVLDSALDCIISMDHEWRITDFNPAAEKTFGCQRYEVLEKSFITTLIPPHLHEYFRKELEHYSATGDSELIGRRVDTFAMRADGSTFAVELSLVRVAVFGPPVYAAFMRDITERKKAELNRDEVIHGLKKTVSEMKTRAGGETLVTQCAACFKVLRDSNEWIEAETYLKDHPHTNFTHGYCHECARTLYPEVFADEK